MDCKEKAKAGNLNSQKLTTKIFSWRVGIWLFFYPQVQWRNHGIFLGRVRGHTGVTCAKGHTILLCLLLWLRPRSESILEVPPSSIHTCKYLSCRALGDTSSSAAWRSVRIAFSSPDDRMILARASRAASASAAMTL